MVNTTEELLSAVNEYEQIRSGIRETKQALRVKAGFGFEAILALDYNRQAIEAGSLLRAYTDRMYGSPVTKNNPYVDIAIIHTGTRQIVASAQVKAQTPYYTWKSYCSPDPVSHAPRYTAADEWICILDSYGPTIAAVQRRLTKEEYRQAQGAGRPQAIANLRECKSKLSPILQAGGVESRSFGYAEVAAEVTTSISPYSASFRKELFDDCWAESLGRNLRDLLYFPFPPYRSWMAVGNVLGDTAEAACRIHWKGNATQGRVVNGAVNAAVQCMGAFAVGQAQGQDKDQRNMHLGVSILEAVGNATAKTSGQKEFVTQLGGIFHDVIDLQYGDQNKTSR